MDFISNLALGFSTAGSVENLFFCLIGVILGTLIGVLPGIGATATIAMLLPITFQLEPVSSLIMLAGIYYGAQEQHLPSPQSARSLLALSPLFWSRSSHRH
ncbi:TctA family transporter [Rhizobium rosettiformans]|uniref:TctA family transporter n=1 Tax=Rhizobium rosettiformans TaxID=1368430 RepID=A0A7W8MCA5_9HYPH|nr:TctA family transporter [Rhizobium rosettiformans]